MYGARGQVSSGKKEVGPGREREKRAGGFRVRRKKVVSIRKDKEPGSLSKLPREKLRHSTLGVKTSGRPNKSWGVGTPHWEYRGRG